ncbi:arrestin domain-containing protein 2-like [Haliotis cracherodii]|uniref:arrestin domain-containing protein 2-like n=1 Tax=Haliotis cracherodii TaxID=6455 RepID=UPI0039E88AAB
MGKLQEFCIRLDNSRTVYTSGEVVSGVVVVTISEPMKMRGIRVTFQGKAGVNWKETANQDDDDSKKTVVVHFNAEEIYINHRKLLWGEDSDKDFSAHLPAGHYEFPFSVPLPKNLPCSFEGDHGCVNYKVKATIDKPWKRDHNVKIFFTVLGMYDLNDDPHASEPIVHTAEQTVCCGCCRAGYFSLNYHIDRRGFVPGEEIPLTVEVKNKSNSRLLSEVKFKMVTTYFAHDDSKKQEEELDRFDMDPVTAHSSGMLKTTVDIPPTPPSHLMGCNIIDVDYIIRLKIVPDGCNCDSIEFHDEILIGTIPLRHVVARMLGGEGLFNLTGDREQNDIPSPGATPFPCNGTSGPGATPIQDPGSLTVPAATSSLASIAMPPPVYAKCVHIKGSKLDDDDVATSGDAFTPQYTFYNWKQLMARMKEQAHRPPRDQMMERDETDGNVNTQVVIENGATPEPEQPKDPGTSESDVNVTLNARQGTNMTVRFDTSVNELHADDDGRV